jgi:hypothetical protein
MNRKLTAACTTLAACIAFVALPTIASATTNVTVTHPTGTVLAAGPTKITGTNVGEVKFNGGAIVVSCTSAVLTGTLNKNNKAEAGFNETAATLETATFSGTGAGGECTSNSGFWGNAKITIGVGNGLPFCLSSRTNFAADEFRIRGGECPGITRSITLVIDFPKLAIECRYERTTPTGPMVGTYKTDTGTPSDAIFDLKSGMETTLKGEEGNAGFCPTEESLEMSITFETDEKAPAAPLYIS